MSFTNSQQPAGEIRNYIISTVFVLMAFVFRLIVDPVLGDRGIFSPFVLAVFGSGLWGGFSCGLFAVVLSALLCIGVFLDREPGSVLLFSQRDALYLILFLSGSLIIAWLTTQIRQTKGLVRLKREAEASAEKYRHLVQDIEDYAIFLLDLNGIITSWNKGVEKILGFKGDDFVGRSGGIIFTPEDRQKGADLEEIETALREGRAADERWHLRKDGSRIHVSGVLSAIRDQSGKVIALAKVMRDNTERRLLEGRFRSAVEASPSGMLMTDAEGIIVLVNSHTEKLFGYAPGELIGKSVDILVPQETRRLHESFRETFNQNRETRAMGKGADLFGIRKDGSRVPVEVGLTPLETEEGPMVLSSIVDISDRKAAEKELKRNREALQIKLAQLQSVYATAPAGLCFLDQELRYVQINDRLARINGRSIEEHIGKTVTEILPEFAVHVVPILKRVIEEGKPFEQVERLPAPGTEGRLRDWLLNYSPVYDPQGRLVGINAVIVDITERKELERKLEAALAREKLARDEAEDANRVKSDFLALLSHELRTPLNAIVGWSHLLKSKNVAPGDLQIGLEVIARNARVQARLIDDLLDITRIRAGKLRLELGPQNLLEPVVRALETIRPDADAKGVKLSWVLLDHPLIIQGDPLRLQQIVWNLLANAVKFTPAQGEIRVHVSRAGPTARISIEDTGRGIDPKETRRIFERFGQGEHGKRSGGLGLGLSIVRHLVDLHGGSVSVESPGLGKGSTFTVVLPLMVGQGDAVIAPPFRPTPDSVRGPCPTNLDGVKVLLVEDDESSRDLIERSLSDCKAQVTSAGSAEEAYQVLRRYAPDVIVSDLTLPGESGYKFLERAREENKLNEIPAIALTALGGDEERERAMKVGYSVHLVKPITTQQLVAVVGNAVGREHLDGRAQAV